MFTGLAECTKLDRYPPLIDIGEDSKGTSCVTGKIEFWHCCIL